MKKIFTIVLMTIITSLLSCLTLQAQHSAFQVRSYIMSEFNYQEENNVFTEFTVSDLPQTENFPMRNTPFNEQQIIDVRRRIDGAVIEALIEANPAKGGDVISSDTRFWSFMSNYFEDECDVFMYYTIHYEITNISENPEYLYFGLDADIGFSATENITSSGFKYWLFLTEPDTYNDSSLVYVDPLIDKSMEEKSTGRLPEPLAPGETIRIGFRFAYAVTTSNIGHASKLDVLDGFRVAFDNEPFDDDNNPVKSAAPLQNNELLAVKMFGLHGENRDGPRMYPWNAPIELPYTQLNWSEGTSFSKAVAENIALLNGVDNITVKADGYVLKSLICTDVEDYGGSSVGDQGDVRTYGDGIVEVFQDGVSKLRIKDCTLDMKVHYPQVMFNNSYIVGSGLPTEGRGRGVIDKALSNPDWAAAFDPNNTGQVVFDYSSMHHHIFDPFIDAEFTIQPATKTEFLYTATLPANGIQTFDFLADHDIKVDVSAAGYDYGNNSTLPVEFILKEIPSNPGGEYPSNYSGDILSIYPEKYWKIGFSSEYAGFDLTFDLSDIDGLADMNNIRFLYRYGPEFPWNILTRNYIINGTEITKYVSYQGEYAIGSVDGSLPVEMTTFEANMVKDFVNLNWETKTEVNNYGFEVERKYDDKNWEKIGFVEGHGNSSAPKSYFYTDKPENKAGEVSYRLKQVDTDGSFSYSKTLAIEMKPVEFSLEQNYPNPFNPSTSVSFTLPVKSEVSLKVYDMLGNEVTTLHKGLTEAGRHEFRFNGAGLSSGVYLCRLEASGYVKTVKMTMLK